MNKKRIALALVAGLSLNALMVNVGQVNGNGQVVQALSQDSINKFNSTKFETLKTSVKNVDKQKVEISFDNVDLSTVSSVNSVTFNHDIFTEREGLDSKVTNVFGTWENNKLVVSGMTEPGIYRGEVTITFRDNTKKVFKITLVKKPSDSMTFTTNLSALKMDIKDIKLNGKIFNPTSATISLNGGASKNLVFDKQSASISLMQFGKLKEGDKFTLSVNYGKDGVYTSTSEILLTKQAEPQIVQTFATNGSNLSQNIADSLRNHGNINVSQADVKVNYNNQNSTATIRVGNEDLLTYDQTINGNILGGGVLKISQPVKATFDVSVDNVKSVAKTTVDEFGVRVDNFLPMAGVDYGIDTQNRVNKSGLIGDYKFDINGKTSTYFDASKAADNTQLKPDVEVSGNKASVIYKSGSKTEDLYKNAVLNEQNKISVDLSNNLQHGYVNVPVNFTVDYREDENLINEANNKVKNASVNGQKVEAKIQTRYKDGSNATDPVKTSIILVADVLDAISANATFERITSSTGNIIISSDGLKYDLNAKLIVPGANVQLDTTSSKDGKLVFRVAFDRDINAADTNWTLNANGKTLNGKVDLSYGIIESVNANVKFENNVNTTDTFKVTTDFMNQAINDGVKTFIGTNGNEVNPSGIRFVDLSSNNGNAVRSTVTKGKYQGKYEAGVWTSEQLMNLSITKGESAASGTVNLTIDANFIKPDDYRNVIAARIEYREKVTGNTPVKNWVTAGVSFVLPNNSAVANKSDIKEEPIVKTVTGLVDGKEYEFRVRYTYKDKGNESLIYSNLYTVRVSNTIGTPVGTVVIPVTTSNSTYDFDTLNLLVPSEINYGANKTTKIVSFSYKDKYGNVITEPNHDYSNVNIRFNNDRIVIDGLVPGKQYEEIVFNYIDNLGLTRTVIVKNPKTSAASGSSHEYLANVYQVSFGRPADESGYHFHLTRLENKTTTLRGFLLNMLAEKEFIGLYKTPETKIEALYNAIVARSSDEAGKQFWINEYKKMLPVYGSETNTLKALADRMVNEPELRELAIKLGFKI